MTSTTTTVGPSRLNQTEQDHHTKLTDREFNATVTPKPVVLHGRKFTEFTYTKNESTVGKIPKLIGHVLLWIVANVFTVGLINIRDDYREFAYGGMKKIATGNEDLIGGRTTGFVKGLLLAIGTVGIHPIYRAVNGQTFDNTWDPALKGKAERKMYYAVDEDREALAAQLKDQPGSPTIESLRDTDRNTKLKEMRTNRTANTIKAMGYNPEDKKSIYGFMRTTEGMRQRETLNGYYLIRDTIREGISAFQYIRIEDFNKGLYQKAHSINFWNDKTGKAVTNPDEASRFINMYLACDAEISEGLDKAAKGLAVDQARAEAKARGNDFNEDDPLLLESTLKPSIEKHREVLGKKKITIDPRQGTWRVASDDVNDKDQGRSVRGEFSKKTIELIDTIYNKDMTKNKMDLQGERPYKKKDAGDDDREIELDDVAASSPPRVNRAPTVTPPDGDTSGDN